MQEQQPEAIYLLLLIGRESLLLVVSARISLSFFHSWVQQLVSSVKKTIFSAKDRDSLLYNLKPDRKETQRPNEAKTASGRREFHHSNHFG
jgi:hypothetical protein